MKDYKYKQIEIDSAETFEELAEIAMSILKDMSLEGKPIVQICGPISTGGLGDIDKNFERFKKAVETAGEKGLHVFNQTSFEEAIQRLSKYTQSKHSQNPDSYHMPILEVFYRKIFESGFVKTTLFLPDWQSSKGATWEHNLVTSLGIEIRDYPTEWLE